MICVYNLSGYMLGLKEQHLRINSVVILHYDLPGSLQAALGVIETVSELISSTMLESVYYATVETFRGTVYMLIASIYVCTLTIMRYD